MLHNLAQLPALPRPDSEPGGARAEGALSRVGPRLLLVVHQPAAAAARSTRSSSPCVMPSAHDTRIEPYALFMFCGILPWTWFSSSLNESAGVAHLRRQPDQEGPVPGRDPADRHGAGEHDPLLLRAGDPASASWSDYQRRSDCRRAARCSRSWSLVQLDLHARLRACILSALTVHFRDIRDILSNLLTLWFFATPIIYPLVQVRGSREPAVIVWQATLLKLNPIHAPCIVSYQEILFFPGPVGHLELLLRLGCDLDRRRFLFGYFAVRPVARHVRGGSVRQLPASICRLSARLRVMRGFGAELELLSLKVASSLASGGCRSRQGCDTRRKPFGLQPTLELSACSWKQSSSGSAHEARIESLTRVEDLPALRPAPAVRDAQERAAVSAASSAICEPDETFAGAAGRVVHRASGADARRDRPQRLRQEHDAQAGRRHHRSRRAARVNVDGPHLGAHRARRRLSPGDLRPRERLHQRHHARPDQAARSRAASTRSSSSPSCRSSSTRR